MKIWCSFFIRNDLFSVKRSKILGIAKYFLIIIVISLFLSCTYIKDRGFHSFDKFNSTWQRLTFYHRGKKKIYRILPPVIEENKTYPLIIGLHGWTEEKEAYIAPRYDENSSFQNRFPAFFLAPSNTTFGWSENARWVREIVPKIMETCPIDSTRIYIVGFSMGGAESFNFVEMLHEEEGLMTAAIVRCAGWSRPFLNEPLLSKTALWYNAGADDDLDGVLETFYQSRKYYQSQTGLISEQRKEPVQDGKRRIIRETMILTEELSNRDKYLFSIYSSMGHEYVPVFLNDDVYEWLFRQQIHE